MTPLTPIGQGRDYHICFFQLTHNEENNTQKANIVIKPATVLGCRPLYTAIIQDMYKLLDVSFVSHKAKKKSKITNISKEI